MTDAQWFIKKLNINDIKITNMNHETKIQELKQELRDKFNISNDRDLIKRLEIKDEDKGMLFAWIRYQSAYEYRDGWNNGREDLTDQIVELLTLNR